MHVAGPTGGPWPHKFVAWLKGHARGGATLRNLAAPGPTLCGVWRSWARCPGRSRPRHRRLHDQRHADRGRERRAGGGGGGGRYAVVVVVAAAAAAAGDNEMWRRVRCATEMLVRRALRANPRLALVYLGLTRGWKHGGPDGGRAGAKKAYPFQDAVYRSVLEHYGVPLVSYRDAIWPHVDRPDSRHSSTRTSPCTRRGTCTSSSPTSSPSPGRRRRRSCRQSSSPAWTAAAAAAAAAAATVMVYLVAPLPLPPPPPPQLSPRQNSRARTWAPSRAAQPHALQRPQRHGVVPAAGHRRGLGHDHRQPAQDGLAVRGEPVAARALDHLLRRQVRREASCWASYT